LCKAFCDAEIAGMTLHFWYALVAEIEGLEPFEWRQEVIDFYSSHLLNLIQACVSNLMRFPPHMDDLAEDVLEDLQKHRMYVEETVEDCCRLLGGHVVLNQIDTLLRAEVQSVGTRLLDEWQGLESCLACVGAVWRYIPSDETNTVPYCLNLIPQLPPGILPLRITACAMIGKYASWLTKNLDHLHGLFQYLTQSLSFPNCASASARAIKELCGCVNPNMDIAEPVLLLYEEIAANPGRLKVDDELQILEGVCHALSRTIQDSRSDGNQFLSRLAQPIGNRLALLIADTATMPSRIITEVDRLTVIVRFLLVPFLPPNTHPVIELVQSLWPFLENASIRFPNDAALAECICRFHKHVIRTVGAKAYLSMLEALLKQLVDSFERTRQSPYLYAASICIAEYGKDAAYAQKLYDAVALLSTTFFSFNRNLEELTNHPDVVEEFFYLISKMISFCPEPVVTSPLLHSVAQCAIVGMALDHKGAQKGTMKFLESTVSCGLELREQNKPESQAAVERVLSQVGQAIVNNLARSMTNELPTYSNQVPEILWKLSFLCRSMLTQWLTSALASTNAAPEHAKAEFMNSLDTALSLDEFTLVVRAFQTACDRERRARRIQPARQ
jgi:transportin-3